MSKYAQQVIQYLEDCKSSTVPLDKKYHPTAEGAVKMIPHGADRDEANLIRDAFAGLAQKKIAA